jgi:hypothetical protein
MRPAPKQLVPYFGALVGVTPIVAPVDWPALWTEAETLLASTHNSPADSECPEFLGCGAPDQMAPCPSYCTTFGMPEQYRCNWPPIFYPCRIQGAESGDNYKDRRDRWKWKCPGDINYISCGPWYAVDCCQVYNPGDGCAGNSGLVVCEGVPPGY